MTKITTKKQALAFIDRIADKTLSFGCVILNEVDVEETVTFVLWNDVKGYGTVSVLEGSCKYRYDKEKAEFNKILGHPVRLGDIMWIVMENRILSRQRDKLTYLWSYVDCSKSLQEILESQKDELSKEAKKLFTFLNEIL